jgi:hypothetical protein
MIRANSSRTASRLRRSVRESSDCDCQHRVSADRLRRKGEPDGLHRRCPRLRRRGWGTILWIIAAVLVIFGIVTLVRGAILCGIVLIVIGLLIGPGGVSIFC